MNEVIVIGGGIVGASAAYRLARANVRVTLIDRADQGQATAAGAGIISPATSVRPSPPFFALAFHAVKYYPEMLDYLAEDGETTTGYTQAGAIFVATNDEEAAQLPGIMETAAERRDAGMLNIGETTLISGKEAKELFPALADVVGAIYATGSARVDGRLLRDALRRGAEKHGATVRSGSAEPVRENGRITHVTVDGESLPADAVIVSGGAWSNALGERLGVHIPVYPQRGQILHLDMPGTETGHWPIVLGFHSHYMLTWPGGRVVAGATREHDSGYDYRMTAGGVHEALSEALRIAPGLYHATLHEIRIGLRPASPDQLPMLGQAPGIENLFVATGHGPSGLQLGPYSGAAVADLVCGKPLEADLAPFDAGRFQDQ
jgi:D-amino-acid dehydrogenase